MCFKTPTATTMNIGEVKYCSYRHNYCAHSKAKDDPAAVREEPALIATPTIQPNTEHHVRENAGHVELKIPAWMLQFNTLQISMSPNRVPTDVAGGSVNPSQTIPPPNVHPSTPTRQTHRSHRTPLDHSQGSPPPRTQQPVTAINTSPLPRAAHRYHQYIRPQPIHPLQSGDEAPRPRTFDSRRSHGYYVVIVGPQLGIFHEYW